MNHTSDRLVTTYLDDLARMLDHLDPSERADVLDGVREHITSALDDRDNADEAEVRAVLAELGPPSSVAHEAYAARPVGLPQTAPWASRAWVPPVVSVALGAMLLFAAVAVMGMGAYSSGEPCSSDGGCTQGPISFDGVFAPALAVFLSLTWLWLPTCVLVTASALWTRVEKWTLVLLVPGLLLTFAVLVELGWRLTHTEVGIAVGAWAGLALLAVGGGLTIWRLARKASRDLHTP